MGIEPPAERRRRQRLFDLSWATEKDFFFVEGAGHYDMYDKPEHMDQAIDRLAPFYSMHLGA